MLSDDKDKAEKQTRLDAKAKQQEPSDDRAEALALLNSKAKKRALSDDKDQTWGTLQQLANHVTKFESAAKITADDSATDQKVQECLGSSGVQSLLTTKDLLKHVLRSSRRIFQAASGGQVSYNQCMFSF